MTGAFGYNLALTNTFSGQPPTRINFTVVTPGGGINGIASLQSGSHVTFNGSEFSNCILFGCQGLVTNGSFVGTLTMQGSRFFNGISYYVDISQDSNIGLYNSTCIGTDTVGFHFFGGISSINVGQNTFAPSSGNAWTGASDHYIISNNLCNGAAFSDGGSGTHKIIQSTRP